MGLVLKCMFIVTFVNIVLCSEKKVVCYYGTWATYRWGLGKFDVEHINPDLCTHLIYTFVGLNSDGSGTIISLDPYLDLPDNWGKNNFGKFNALKQKNPNLKTILAVGGWNEGSAKYSVMAANANLRKTFVNSAVNMVLQYNFDGFDVDWEYPNQRDSINGQADVENYTLLLKELKQALAEHGLLLSIAVAAVESSASLSYDVAAISQYADFINLMTYDMYGSWDPVTGHNAPLHKGEGDENIPRNQVYSVDVALEYWISEGCPPEKLNVGLPIYGRTFKLSNAASNGVRAPASGPGIGGPYTQTNGLIGFNEFCVMLQSEEWDHRVDSLAKVPYAVQDLNWVSYDNPDSVQAKLEYGLSLGIGGAMVWSIETDDFHGLCGEDFPILRTINRSFGLASGTNSSNATTTTSTTTTTQSTSTKSPATSPSTKPSSSATMTSTASPSVCKEEGLIPNPEDCTKFYYCIRNVEGELEAIGFGCPEKLAWDQSILACNYAEFVNCVI